MNSFFSHGSIIAIRGLIYGRVRFVQSVIVEHDTADESAVVLLPGAQCAFPDWYAKKRDDGPLHSSRWAEALKKQWELHIIEWSTNRFLMITRPGDFYSVYLIWDHGTDRFICYYVNFQLPYARNHYGFDTYDLELDIVVEPNGEWRLKDQPAYLEGIRTGVIRREWADAVAKEKDAVIATIEKRKYPFNNYWRDYMVDQSWMPPRLPDGWEQP